MRRSFNGTYTPVYQAAYMLGALQFRALRKELVESGKMTNPQFHDLILQGGRMPVEMVGAAAQGEAAQGLQRSGASMGIPSCRATTASGQPRWKHWPDLLARA